ncbi:DegQ family serine endoprotease [Pseudomaricurvus alkylphenolicus]|uniref:DegQ family serine endoprotease n=1 Tax=Pseudomaricurvus alkylphenolicus TaxID=1306991 RepID=UPI00197F977C|nr:DegQ family serine endoprotease [Pseudomaricurvus alkylphenolicus]
MTAISLHWQKWFCLAAMALLATSASARGSLPEFTDLIEQASPAVVKINTIERRSGRRQFPQGNQDIPDIFRHLFEPRRMPERQAQSLGSGFIVSEDGYILTNNHVIDGADEIHVRLLDRREYQAEVIGTDERSDIALLKIEEDNLPTLEFADDDELKVGQWVLAIGSPFGLDFSASAGIVSAIGRSIPSDKNENYVPFIQTDVAINPGNSGGPLFNLDGEVVGINSQIYTRSGGSIGLSFAIPVSVAREVMNQLKEKGRVDRGWLGVVIQEVDKDLAASFGLSKPVGALIAQMEPGSPADKGGLKVGDVIIRFGKTRIESSSDLPHAVGAVAPGTEVAITVMREGRKKVLEVEVGTLGGSPKLARGTAPEPESGGRLGVLVGEVDPRLRNSWQVSGGVMVKRVFPGSPAAGAGLRPGDVIVQLGFEKIESLQGFEDTVADLPADSLLPVRFYRQGRALFRSLSIKD